METAGSVVADALGEIVVLGGESSLAPDDGQVCIRYLNRMMAAFDTDGIDLGYTIVSNLSDEITVPAGAIDGIIPQLAVRLHAQFSQGEPLPQDLIARAISGKNTMRNLAINISASEFPDTLPVGSGNESAFAYRTPHFYTSQEAKILAETNGNISLEDGTT